MKTPINTMDAIEAEPAATEPTAPVTPHQPVGEIDVRYRNGAQRFELRQFVDGVGHGPARPASMAEVLQFQVLRELKAIRAALEK